MAEPDGFEFTSPGKNVDDIYPSEGEEEEEEDFLVAPKGKGKRSRVPIVWSTVLNGVSYVECQDMMATLSPEGVTMANKQYKSKKTSAVTQNFKCALNFTHGCGVHYKIVKGTTLGPTVTCNLYSRGTHDHTNFIGKGMSKVVKDKCKEAIHEKLPPKAIFKKLSTAVTTAMEADDDVEYKVIKNFVYNNRKQILGLKTIKTCGQFMEVCQTSNLLAIPVTDRKTAGTLCMFEGQVLQPSGFETVEHYAENSANTLPPIPFEAQATQDELTTWKLAGWNEDFSVYERNLQAHFNSILACESAEYFVHILENMLVVQGWSTRSKRFYKGKLNLRALYKNYTELVKDYVAAQKRKRWCVIYTTWGKLEVLLAKDHRSRDDTYKTNWQGLPLECNGSSYLDKRFRLGALAIKSHEDAYASQIVDFCLIAAMQLGFQKVWQPRYHTLDHSLAFFNANAKLPETITHVLEHLRLPTNLCTLVAEEITQGICWSHCMMKLNEKTALFNDAHNVNGFKQGVTEIHNITIVGARDSAFKLFIELYKRDEEYICNWFVETWWGKWGGWVLGFMPEGIQSTQNSPECVNRHVKDEMTLRKQLQLEVFHPSALKYMHEETIYDGQHPIPTTPVITQAIWREALLMIDNNMLELMTRTTGVLGVTDRPSYVVPSLKTFEKLSASTIADKRKEIAPLVVKFLALMRDPEHPPAVANLCTKRPHKAQPSSPTTRQSYLLSVPPQH
ncbi:hypothetical protein CYMTET_47465 [Cymbomonas tetramitiformis]|uniref:Uncharacterized protein n=1 Tax=Cymbomonas tetramitiformis TaxID=36881 RepID=A0AAE0BW37_9CHLO|nr:hypothetical protein CYMTET_47465 [Cymbomonas tetramitiformis]